MQQARFSGRVAVITGGTSGIGAAIARRLVSEGAKVVLAARRSEPGQALVQELGSERAVFFPCDVTEPAQVQALIAESTARFGGLDLLINNAGQARVGTTLDLDARTWHELMNVNLHAVFYACQAAIPQLQRRGGGSIVNVASISGLAADYGLPAYCAAKAAVINYTRALALDHAAAGIRANVVCPGLIDTPMTGFVDRLGARPEWTRSIPLRRAGTPDEIAAVVAFVASDEASFMTGSVLTADGGLSAATGQPSLPELIATHRPE